MVGKRLLERGLFGRVGDGNKIKICKDRWVNEAPCHPIVPLVPLPDELTVDFLIETGQWKDELVHACFRPVDAERIIKMPLSHYQTEDVASWPFTKSGIYTVKSAYIMAKRDAIFLNASVKGKTECSDQAKSALEWKKYGELLPHLK